MTDSLFLVCISLGFFQYYNNNACERALWAMITDVKADASIGGFLGGSPEKAMAPHSSTLAWRVPWTEEPGRLQSMGSLESDTTERLHFHFPLACIGEGNGNPLQCSCLENPRDGGAWWAAVYGVAQSWTWLKRLSLAVGGSLVKNPPADAGDVGSIPGLGRCPGEGNGNPLQYSCLGNPMDIRVWQTTVHGVTKSQTQLSYWACTHAKY